MLIQLILDHIVVFCLLLGFVSEQQVNVFLLAVFLQPRDAKGGKKKGKTGGKKKSAKTKTPVVIDGVSTEEMSKEQVNVNNSF